MSENTEAAELTLADVEMEISEEQLAGRRRDYKAYRPKSAFRVEVIAAVNQKSQFGQAQVQLDIAACDEDGKPVGQSVRWWYTYPFNMKGMDPMDAKTIQRVRDELGEILRARDPEKFAFYGRIEGKGNKKKYFDKEGNLLTAEAKVLVQKEGNRRILLALQEHMTDASKWLGPVGYGTFVTFKKRNGKEASKFQNFSSQPNPNLPLVTDPAEFYVDENKAA